VADAGGERGPVEERGGQHVHRVEPAPGLADVLHDEVPGEVVLEPLRVLERVVHLGEGHRAGVEPHVQHLRDAAHRRATGRVVRVGPGQPVDERPVQVGDRHPEVRLELGEGAVDICPGVGGVVRLPHRNRAAPEAVSADRPVARVGQPLAELPVLDVLRHPGDLLVELDHAVPDLGHLDEPARHRHVDQRLTAAPAVRVGVVVALAAQQHRAGSGRPQVTGARASPPRVRTVRSLRWSMMARLASKTSMPS